MPGGCPSFVPSSLVEGLSRNKGAISVANVGIGICAQALIGSVFAAPFGVGLLGVSALLLELETGCDTGKAIQQEAADAAKACNVGAVACGIATVAAVAGIVTAPASIPLAGVAAVLGASSVVLGAIGKGRPPKASDVSDLIDSIAPYAGVDTSSFDGMAQALDAVLSTPAAQQAIADAGKGATVATTKDDRIRQARKRQALNAAKTNAAASTRELMQGWIAAGKPGTFQQYMTTHTARQAAHDSALAAAKVKARQATLAAQGHTPTSPVGGASSAVGMAGAAAAQQTGTAPATTTKHKVVGYVAGGVGALGLLGLIAKVVL